MVQINVHVIDPLNKRKRLIGKQIVYVKCVFRKFHSRFSQDFCAEHQRVHNQILGWFKFSDLIPCAHLSLREHVFESHAPARALIQMIIYIVTDKKIRYLFFKFAPSASTHVTDSVEQNSVGIRIQPVIGIHYLVVESPGKLQSLVHPGSVAAVFLMYHTHNVRIYHLILIRNLRCPVHRSVIDQDNLHIFASQKKRIHASPHIAF